MAVDIRQYAKRSEVRLTTTGRQSGKPRTVRIWFVVEDANTFYVQHAEGPTSQWFKNLQANNSISADFGDGAMAGEGVILTEEADIRQVMKRFRKKYFRSWIFQLLAWGKLAAAAKIHIRAE